ncbi:hypothetical protein S83_038969 [Arachis hypogaea]
MITLQGKRLVSGDGLQVEPGYNCSAGGRSRRRIEEGRGHERDPEGMTRVVVAGGSDAGEKAEVETSEVDRERRQWRDVFGLNVEQAQAQGTSCNIDMTRMKNSVEDAGHSIDNGIVSRGNTLEDESHIRSTTELRLEEGETLMEGGTQGHRNWQEDVNEHGTESGSEAGTGSEGDNKITSEEHRPSWDEEMAENKEAWKLAVESGAQCSDKEDIMAILQEQNDAIVEKRRQAKQKAKARRSRPKNPKQVCNKFNQ